MPAPIVLSTLTPETKKVLNPPTGQPVISTKADLRDGSRPTPPPPPTLGDGSLLFSDNFDAQADWTPPAGDVTTFAWDGQTLPTGWSAAYNASDGFPALPTIQITSNPFGAGKVLMCSRENRNPPGGAFGSNGYLGVLFDQDYSEIYIEFYIAFQDGWTHNDAVSMASKIFRVWHSDRDPVEFWGAFTGHQGPLFVWDWSESANYGARNGLAFRGGPPGENYDIEDLYPDVGVGRRFVTGSLGDISMNWTSDLQNSLDDLSSPQIPDKLNGGFLPASGSVLHPQVYGPAGTFTKLGFYLKMNSAPGVEDGLFRQYLDDILIVDSPRVPWVPPTSSPMPGWNAFALGGNDEWMGGRWTEADQREEYYVIDNVSVFNGLPEALR